MAPIPLVSMRHNGTAGRARLEIRGLRGNDALGRVLERFHGDAGIRRLSASTITGNVLVFYDPDRELPQVIELLEAVVRHPPEPPPPPAKPAAGAPWGLWDVFRSLVRGDRAAAPPRLTPSTTRPHLPAGWRAPLGLTRPWHAVGAVEAATFWRVPADRGLGDAEAASRLVR
jgi:hypothetical protein